MAKTGGVLGVSAILVSHHRNGKMAHDGYYNLQSRKREVRNCKEITCKKSCGLFESYFLTVPNRDEIHRQSGLCRRSFEGTVKAESVKDREEFKMRISKKKIILFIVLFIFVVALILGAGYLKKVADYKQAVKETAFTEIDVADVSDGIYIGEYDVNFIYAKVEVTVENGKIVSIHILEHRHERGKAAETVIEKIIEEQEIDVDAISGATNSSTVIKKAVENALKGES